ncbi:hypothetical protein QBC36DRAFT_365448, partial [Triangularia setosa]
MPRAGTSRSSIALWGFAGILFLLCVSPALYSSTTRNKNVPNRWEFHERRDVANLGAAAIPDIRRGPAHSNPLKAAAHEPFIFEDPLETTSTDLSPRSPFSPVASLSKRDGPLYCHDGPCIDGSCCGPDNVCGFGPDFCGEGCRFNCTATAMCGQYSEDADIPCGMKLCCSATGWCGTTDVYCHNADPLRGTLPCQPGYGSCYITGPPSCPYGGGSTSGRHIGYYQSWNVRNRLCNKVSPRQLNTTGYTHLFYSFASIDPVAFTIAPAHPDDPAMMREFTGLAKPGLKTWIAIGGFDFSDKGTPTHHTWSEMCATPSRRAAFIASVKDYMDEYGFTGVDIDWEYPGDPDRGGNKLADTRNLVALVREMRAAYGSNYGISLTLAPDYWYLRWFDAKAMEPYVDFFGFMAYDLHGPWDADVKALGSKVRGQADIREISENTKPLWFDGLNPAKLNFGLALYGRGYTLADPSCSQLLCPFSGGSNPAPCTNFEGVMSLHEIQQLIDRKGLTPQYLPDSMMKQITWDDQWIGYDDDETFAAKKAWADSKCFGGTMVWSIDFQVAGSGDSDADKYGDVVYVGSEVFETPTAQCPAPCIMVFPSSSLPEPKVITMQPYTATLEVGTTTTTVVAVMAASTTTVTVVNFFNHYITRGQQAGAVVTLRPSFQPPPVMLVVTGQDGQTTTRTVVPPPLGGGASGSAGANPNPTISSSTVSSQSTTRPSSSIDLPLPTYTPRLLDVEGPEQQELSDDSDDDDDPPTPVDKYPDLTHIIEPVTDTSKPPPPGSRRVKCDSWFFFICISWIELDLHIEWWDIVLPPTVTKIGPGPPPGKLFKFPVDWDITGLTCPSPPCLPPWPELTGLGTVGPLPTPAKPIPCEPVTATITISTTSYLTTTTQGTVRTISSRTLSSEFPILGCALTDATISVSKTACATPRPTPRSIDDGVAGPEVESKLAVRDDDEDWGEDCDDSEKLIDVVVVPADPLSANSLITAELDLARTENHSGGKKLDSYTVISSDTPLFVAFIYLKNVKEGYAKKLRGQFGVRHFSPPLAGQAYRIPPPPFSPPTTPPGRKRHAAATSLVQTNTTQERVANVQRRHQQNQRVVKRTTDYGPNYGLAHLGIPPEEDFLDFEADRPFVERFYFDDNRHGFLYQRHESECEGQSVYIIENAFDREHPHFRQLRANMKIDTLPRKIYGNWEGHVDADPEHATNVASIVAGEYNGVCPLGLLTLVGTQIPGTAFPGTVDPDDVRGLPLHTPGRTWLYIEALVEALKHIRNRDRGTKSVINMSWGVKINQDATDKPIRDMLTLLLQQLDNLGVVLVAATPNTLGNDDPFFRPRIPDQAWPQTADVPNLILVGASTLLGRVSLFTTWPEPWYDEDEDEDIEVPILFAPGEDVILSTTHPVSWGGIHGLTIDAGASFAAPQVAGLVAYLRAMERRLDPNNLLLKDPGNVKVLLASLSRMVYTANGAAHPGPYDGEDNEAFGQVVNPVWNGQLDDRVECIFNPTDDCPPGDFRSCLRSESPESPNRRARKRQTGGSCPYLPGYPGNGGQNPNPGNGDGGGGGGGGVGGGDVGGQDQLGPSKTFTYSPGTPSPTCTSGCGALCTDWWCRPDRTGLPPHFTDPTRLPAITPAPTITGGIPYNCISSTTTRSCQGDRQGQTCNTATVCLATATGCPGDAVEHTTTICQDSNGQTICETLPPLPEPTSLDCTGDWFTSTAVFCNGGTGGHGGACQESIFCAITPRITPTYRVVDDSKCPKAGDICARKSVATNCPNNNNNNKARGLPVATITATVTTAPSVPTPLMPSSPPEGSIRPPRRPRQRHALPVPAALLPPVDPAQLSPAPLVSPARNNILLAARQELVCDLVVTCTNCVTPKPNIPDPCIEVYMLSVATGIGGVQLSVELSKNGKVICRPSNLCGVGEKVEDCWGAENFKCGNGDRIDDWLGAQFNFYSKEHDKVFSIEAKITKEGVYDPCNGGTCIGWIWRGKTGRC